MKTRSLALLLAVLLLLTACGSKPAETTAPAQTTVPTTAPVETTEPPSTTAPPETTAPAVLTRYPLNTDSAYLEVAQELPNHIYTTTGSENGLGGTVYTFTGTVLETSTSEIEGTGVEQILVETNGGNVMIANFYKWMYNSAYRTYGKAAADSAYPYPVSDYRLPGVGESGEFIAVYVGYSGAAEMPMFYLGANPALFEAMDCPDPAQTATGSSENASTTVSISGNTVTAGNLKMHIPSGYTAEQVNDNAVMLGSPDGKCGISIFAADISDLDEAAAMAYIPMQRESFYADDAVQSEIETIGPYEVGGFDVNMEVYSEIYTDLSMYSVLATTFTDSWYGYTILLKTAETSTEDYATAYGQMVLTATYTGAVPRFDFVQ